MNARFSLYVVLFLAVQSAPAMAFSKTPSAVEAALAESLVFPEARVLTIEYRPTLRDTCSIVTATVGRAIDGSGRYPVKLSGAGCGGWAWVRVQVFAPVLVTTRMINSGEPLAGAVRTIEREILSGHRPATLSPGTVAARRLQPGHVLEQEHVRIAGPAVGEAIKIVVRSGSLTVEQRGRIVSCGLSRICAVLPSGKHVEGRLENERLFVEVL